MHGTGKGLEFQGSVGNHCSLESKAVESPSSTVAHSFGQCKIPAPQHKMARQDVQAVLEVRLLYI